MKWHGVLADKCPPLNGAAYKVKGAWFDKTDNSFGDVIRFTCLNGKLFPDGDRVKTVECMAGGQWSEVLDDCQGRLVVIPSHTITPGPHLMILTVFKISSVQCRLLQPRRPGMATTTTALWTCTAVSQVTASRILRWRSCSCVRETEFGSLHLNSA